MPHPTNAKKMLSSLNSALIATPQTFANPVSAANTMKGRSTPAVRYDRCEGLEL